jgi:hypothetical protein
MTVNVLTPPQVAARWKCKPESVRKLLEAGALRGFMVSPPGTKRPHWRVTLDAVINYESGTYRQEQDFGSRRRRVRKEGIPTGPF